jgi:tRNA/rRNA methyltransferase
MNCRVVLVRPQLAANIGAVARVMRNMGLSELVLVSPEAGPTSPQATALATHGADVLERCRTAGDLVEAVADCVLVAGTTARTGGLVRRQSSAPPEEVMPRMVAAMQTGPVALVFGPESTGLDNDEVSRCHFLIHVPTDESFAALNLAQAAAITLYDLRRTWLQQTVRALPEAPAPFADQERMFEQLRSSLEQIGFLFGERADVLWHAVRHLLGRAAPTPMEVKLVLGLARQLRWYVDHHSINSDSPESTGGDE